MNTFKSAMVAAATCLAVAMPSTAAADPVTGNAENIRKLDIMLMVTSLRCRNGADNFQADYRKFSATHIGTLNRAGRHLQANLTHRHGSRGAKRALDKISVGMANEYGQGHPWLECAELKQVTRDLTSESDTVRFSEAATELLSVEQSTRWASR